MADADATTLFMERFITRTNPRRALRQVVANQGAPGCDRTTARRLVREWPRRETMFICRFSTGSFPV